MSNLPLLGKTIIFTGTKKPVSVMEKVSGLGGNPLYFPLIKTAERIDNCDKQMLEEAKNVDWLIFTSQNAIKYFCKKLNRHQLTSKDFSAKIAAVGDKTKTYLKKNGFSVHFMPSVFSADVFVEQFPNEYKQQSCLFLRGNLAKDTLERGIPNLKQWTVYETVENEESVSSFIQLLKNQNEVIIVFASPSAVDVFAKQIAINTGWEKVKIASIGHITTNQIEKYGQIVTYQPQTYTLESIIDEIINREDVSND